MSRICIAFSAAIVLSLLLNLLLRLVPLSALLGFPERSDYGWGTPYYRCWRNCVDGGADTEECKHACLDYRT